MSLNHDYNAIKDNVKDNVPKQFIVNMIDDKDANKVDIELKHPFFVPRECSCDWYQTWKVTRVTREIRCIVCQRLCDVRCHDHLMLYEKAAGGSEKDYSFAFDSMACLKRYEQNRYDTIHAYSARIHQHDVMSSASRTDEEVFMFPLAPSHVLEHFVPGGIPVEDAHKLAATRHIVDIVPPVVFTGKKKGASSNNNNS